MSKESQKLKNIAKEEYNENIKKIDYLNYQDKMVCTKKREKQGVKIKNTLQIRKLIKAI